MIFAELQFFKRSKNLNLLDVEEVIKCVGTSLPPSALRPASEMRILTRWRRLRHRSLDLLANQRHLRFDFRNQFAVLALARLGQGRLGTFLHDGLQLLRAVVEQLLLALQHIV